ncbi:hypothetical protein FACS1894126_4570 [Alphaproteobacteria bacterium]|nr:hypothetical protein FACS1894126_4570 [Alphaproteobacteria bacterium]
MFAGFYLKPHANINLNIQLIFISILITFVCVLGVCRFFVLINWRILCLKKISQKSKEDALSKLEVDASNLLRTAKEVCKIFSNPQNAQACNEELLIVSIVEQTAFANGIEIISSRAHLQLAIFEILFEHYKEHYFETETSFLNTKQIIRLLIETKTPKIAIKAERGEITQANIVEAICKIKSSTIEKLNNEIIIADRWKGYAINSNVVLKKGAIYSEKQ